MAGIIFPHRSGFMKSEEFLADFPPFAERAEDIAAFVRGAEVIMHNAEFDEGFLTIVRVLRLLIIWSLTMPIFAIISVILSGSFISCCVRFRHFGAVVVNADSDANCKAMQMGIYSLPIMVQCRRQKK